MLWSFVIVAVIPITAHHSVFFHYLISISLSTPLLTTCLLIISNSPKPLIYNVVLVKLHIHQYPPFSCSTEKPHNRINSTASSCIRSAFCIGFWPNFQALLEKTERTYKTLQELSQPLFTVNGDKFSLLIQTRLHWHSFSSDRISEAHIIAYISLSRKDSTEVICTSCSMHW